MDRRIPGGLLVVAAAAMVAAGCGDDDGEDATTSTGVSATTTSTASTTGPSGGSGGVTLEEWAKKADAICAKGDRELDAEATKLFTDMGLSQNEQPSPAQLERYVDDVLVPNIQDQIYDVFEIPQPEGDEKQIQAFLDSAQSELHHIQDVPSDLTGSKDPFAKSSKLAQDLGLRECASD